MKRISLMLREAAEICNKFDEAYVMRQKSMAIPIEKIVRSG
jgi:hypothetical protein